MNDGNCNLVVMAGLDPAIHVSQPEQRLGQGRSGATWMPGSSPGMTAKGMTQKGILAVLLAVLVSSPLAACGKKAHLDTPPGSTYPRQYPPSQ